MSRLLKHSLSLVLLPALLASCGGDSGPPDDGGGNPPPGGGEVTKEIGPGGGSIATSDGAIGLTFPAGALPSATSITVKKAAASAANGIGQAYEILPAGLAISKPVTLTMGVSAAQLGDAGLGDVGIAVRSGSEWYADLTSNSQTAEQLTAERITAEGPTAEESRAGEPGAGSSSKRTGASRVHRVMDGGDVSITLESVVVEAVSVVTFWKWQPTRPRVRTTESVTITILACFGEDQNSIYTNSSGVQITTRRRIPTTCGPSVREATWTLEGSAGSTDPLDVGRVTWNNPSSVANYTAPARMPAGGSVKITAHLFWPELNRTNNLPNFVLVDQSTEWGGNYSWTISGTHETAVHSDFPVPVDITTSITRDGSGQVQLHALPNRVYPLVAILDPSSIVATDHVKMVITTVTHGECTTTKEETWDVSGNNAEFPTGISMAHGEMTLLFGQGSELALAWASVQWEGEGTFTIKTTVACGDDDELVTTSTTPTTMTLGPELAGGFAPVDGLYHTQLDLDAPNVIEGTASWKDGIHGWATTEMRWSVRRP